MSLTRRRILSLGAATAAATAVALPASTAVLARAPTCPPGTDAGAFLHAVEAGDLGEVRRWLRSDATLAAARDAQGRSAFVIAHLAGRTAVAQELRGRIELDVVEAVLAEDWARFGLLAKADPELCTTAHAIGGTPLYAGALAGSRDLSRLRAAGCRPDLAPAAGSGLTPARAAMSCRTISGARCAATDLLGNGSDPNAAQRGADSVLHGAVRRRSELLVRLAIRKGADPAARDRDGRTPQDLAGHLEWDAGVRLLAQHASLPRDHRASRWLFDAKRQPIVRPDLSAVPQARQNEVTGSSHTKLDRVRELVAADPRLVFSVSTDDELAIEACAHTGNRPIIRLHLEHGAPLSLPTAVALGDHDTIRVLLDRDPLLIHERGAHDFPVMWYVPLGGGGVELAELLHRHGVAPDQESLGITALHWCARDDERELAAWLIAKGADVEALGFKFDRDGQTPLQVARTGEHREIAAMLEKAGARR
ncbi:MAG TPA: ankyrin repeat domain-containing protein [Planctomycetota bacterium]|nr:ankyrin repeat domain-containing protein [Planctomycetota bacterium]